MNTLTFKWHQYNLNVICDRCSKPIPCQHLKGKPVCEHCGTVSEHDWKEVVDFSKIKKLKQWATGSTTLGGFMRIEMNYKEVPNVPCFNCHHPLVLQQLDHGQELSCSHCTREMDLIPYEDDLFFYYHPNKTGTANHTIAVRCASCGAPCEADSTHYEFNCNFCKTLNIIPPSMRANKALDDVYIGWKQK